MRTHKGAKYLILPCLAFGKTLSEVSEAQQIVPGYVNERRRGDRLRGKRQAVASDLEQAIAAWPR